MERLNFSRLLLGKLLFKKRYDKIPNVEITNGNNNTVNGKPAISGPAISEVLNDIIPKALNKKVIRQKKTPVKATDSKNAFGLLLFM